MLLALEQLLSFRYARDEELVGYEARDTRTSLAMGGGNAVWKLAVVFIYIGLYELTALRQTWTPMTALPFWAPLALLGFAPWMILTQQAVSLIYQFWIHTERVKKLPAPFEFFFNTPSHHRVHHGANDVYLDRNYGGSWSPNGSGGGTRG